MFVFKIRSRAVIERPQHDKQAEDPYVYVFVKIRDFKISFRGEHAARKGEQNKDDDCPDDSGISPGQGFFDLLHSM